MFAVFFKLLLYKLIQTWCSFCPICCPGQGPVPLLHPPAAGGAPETDHPPGVNENIYGWETSPETQKKTANIQEGIYFDFLCLCLVYISHQQGAHEDLCPHQAHLQLLVSLSVLDPGLALALGVYQQRIAGCLRHHDAILDGEVIVG